MARRGEEEKRCSLRWFSAEAEGGEGAEGRRRKEGDTAYYYLAWKRRLRWAHLASPDIFPSLPSFAPAFPTTSAALITPA